eukprot:TRINITY_DN20952_c0_g2_i1.p1 TRINITY_DN20952_c0_g2~~TRINITY_DN20952_c0_g2_i1.p1  ORF type:complete len:503 (+),score=97.59 TRINITY_DN20952_c0_g2_i1:100-1608(+)
MSAPPPPVDASVAIYTILGMVLMGVAIWFLVGRGKGLADLGGPAISRGSIARRKGNIWKRPSKVDESTRPTPRIQEARANSQTDFKLLKEEAIKFHQKGRTWRDEEFPADDASLFEDPSNPPTDWLRESERGKPIRDAVVAWKGPEDFCKTRKPLGKTWLYADAENDAQAAHNITLDSNKICQGSLGDCYLLSALAAATKSLLVADDLIDEELAEYGVYGVSFWVQGRWEMVWVDDQFPCYRPKASTHSGRWRLVFASCEDPTEIWPLVVEKAYAKLYGSYQALSGGQVSKALVALTGGSGACMNLQSPFCSANSVFNVVKSAKKDAEDGTRFIGAGTKGYMQEAFANGIVTGHAYTVQDACEAAGTRLIKLRNPWNQHEWKGDWSDGSNKWQSDAGRELKKAIGGTSGGDDGEFWMSLEDFMQRFQTLDFCDLKIEGREDRMNALKEAAKGDSDSNKSGSDKKKSGPNDDRNIDDLLAFIEGDAPMPKKGQKHGKHDKKHH